jgi:hypothetical protein
VPTIRKRVGTEFALSEALLQRMKSSPEEELLAKLELEFEIQSKITSAGKNNHSVIQINLLLHLRNNVFQINVK